ncbi:hypothetical protein QVD17_37613 [Tagetes erecta]|uniref:Protein kinase domain-containing protein n=1 Tax=Tagetes erecta TaxID=13708 RepID=A0AAD8JUJ3_TARER|nr:hypothetical protein QVD17_37613 [Tagetes erecta]
MARRHFNKGKLKDIVDPKIMEETREYSYALKIGPDQDSFTTFSKIAYQCLEETQSERPKLEVVIKSLEKALEFQSQNLEHLTIPLEVHHGNQAMSTINTIHVAGTNVYLDPEYVRTGKLKKESDIYSLGVVLFEIFSGKLAYDSSYIKENEKGLAPVARKHFKRGTLEKILDQKIMDEVKYELGVCVQEGPTQNSLKAFSEIANKCLAKEQAKRPTIEVIIKTLKALYFQENRTLKISLERIKSDIENFGECIMKGGYGMLYKGNVRYDNQHKKVLVKRFSRDWYLNDATYSWEHGFLKEFEVLFKYKHESIIGLEGYCKEMEEKIIIYEYASNGSLDGHLDDASFTWTQRLKICVDIANGLNFLHGGDKGRRDVVIHRDIKSSNILLTEDWKAKICGFEHALTHLRNKKIKYVIDHVESSPGYNDPMFQETHFLTEESDIYSFGVILFEILCGRLALPKDFRDRSQLLDVVIKGHLPEAPFDDMVFVGIKEQIKPNSLATFGRIAFQCLSYERKKRPTAADVVAQLQKALDFQEAYETPESKFRSNEKDIPSTSRKINSAMAKKEICDILSKRLLLEDDKQEIIRVLQDREKFTPEEEADYQSEPIIGGFVTLFIIRRTTTRISQFTNPNSTNFTSILAQTIPIQSRSAITPFNSSCDNQNFHSNSSN